MCQDKMVLRNSIIYIRSAEEMPSVKWRKKHNKKEPNILLCAVQSQ